MLAAAPAAAVRAPTRPPALVPRGCARRGGSERASFGSRPVARARPRPGACVRFARTSALASRDRIAGSAVRALDPRRRSARSSSSSPAAAPIFVSAAFEVDERDADDASDLDVFDEPTVSIPISFFSILNVTPARASPAAIEAAYAGVINRELVDGFSDGCLAARADLVDAAAQVLSDPDLRREHEDDVKNGRLTPVPASQLGGALALMQEAGEHESVIEYAPECLAAVSRNAAKGARRDITLSAALAHCELSHDALTAMPPRVGEGCELLDIASSILVAEAGPGFSKELQETIHRTLQEMAPAYVIELLSMPLEAEKERKEGLRALRQILWGGSRDDVGSLNDRDAYVRECTDTSRARKSSTSSSTRRRILPPTSTRFTTPPWRTSCAGTRSTGRRC